MKNDERKVKHLETKVVDGYTINTYVEECSPEELEIRRRSFAHLAIELHRKINEDIKN